MLTLLKDIFRPLYYFLSNKYYRTYCLLFSRYLNSPRHQQRQIQFLNYKMEVADAKSFIYQYKEIFLDDSYRFKTGKPNPVIFDCGANIGTSCLYFKSEYPDCSIKAFEADATIFQLLKKNIMENFGDKNIEFINAAVWTNDDGVRFSSDGADGGSVISVNENARVIPSIRLKTLLENHAVDLLKIDIEGAEADVLMDCDGSLGNVEHIFFEYHAYRNSAQQLDALLKVMTRNGFRYFIQSPELERRPFLRSGHGAMDLQLNVYCQKIK